MDIPYDVLKQEAKELKIIHAKLKTELDQAKDLLSVKEMQIIQLTSQNQMKNLHMEDTW